MKPSRLPACVQRLLTRGSSRLAIGQTGVAIVRVMVSPDGTPQNAEIIKISNPQLTAAAIETAVSSTYAPALKNGQKVAGKYVATFSFNGEDPATASVPIWKRSPAPPSSPP
jgi:TonB family protein